MFIMKKLLLISVLLFSISLFARDPWNPARAYCEIVGTGNLTGTKVKIEIDFGQAKHFWTGSTDKFLVDKSGKEIKFNSMVDALNYMSQFGWRFEQAYVVTENSSMSKQNVYHYLLSKELSGDTEMDSGIYTRRDFKDDQVDDQSKKEKKRKERVRDEKGSDDLYY
jgi:hypothetical protein